MLQKAGDYYSQLKHSWFKKGMRKKVEFNSIFEMMGMILISQKGILGEWSEKHKVPELEILD